MPTADRFPEYHEHDDDVDDDDSGDDNDPYNLCGMQLDGCQ